ncbi:MAG TPA: radical SAM protein [Bacteroidota bacterium]|nr:radical SAM protein [Bacteroidota bacterium]
MSTYKYVFGPVPSRRLGRSLGIDIIPSKLCTLDCIYCEVGKTDKRGLARKEYFPTNEIIEEARRALNEFTQIDYVTVTGSGEPTLHKGIGEIIHAIKGMTSVPIAVLTNGTLLYLPEVRASLLDADVVSPSLDAVTDDVFQKIDRPNPKLRLQEIIEGMKQFRREYKGKLWIEILFVKGINDGDDEVQKLKKALDEIQPDKIHLNTVVRPPTEFFALPISENRMREIQQILGEKAEIISSFSLHHRDDKITPHSELILAALERRPMTGDELAAALSVSQDNILQLLHQLEETKKIREVTFEGKKYYQCENK